MTSRIAALPPANSRWSSAFSGAARHAGVRRIEHQPIRAPADGNRSGRLSDRGGAVFCRIPPQASADVRLAFPGEYAAAPLAQPLLVLHPAQLLGRTHGGLAVGADAHRSPALKIGRRRKIRRPDSPRC